VCSKSGEVLRYSVLRYSVLRHEVLRYSGSFQPATGRNQKTVNQLVRVPKGHAHHFLHTNPIWTNPGCLARAKPEHV
jgi:hypothetical protein